MKKPTQTKKKLELTRSTVKTLTDERTLAQLIGGRGATDCAGSNSHGCSGVGC